MELGALLITLVAVLLCAKLAGEAAERLGQTAVLGELLAGVVLGPSGLGLIHESEILRFLAEIGVILLLFEIGLHSDLDQLISAGVQATAVAIVGVVAPLLLGYALARAWDLAPLTAVFVGATLTATSVGITARVLADLGRLEDPNARIVLGAAVIDDILGLIILALVTGLARTGRFSTGVLLWTLLTSVVFLVVALVLGVRLAPWLLRLVNRMRVRGVLIVYAVTFCLLLAAISEHLGLATIIGAFAAGLVLAKTDDRAHIQELLHPTADLFVPVFFVMIGLKVELGVFSPSQSGGLRLLLMTAMLTVAAVIGKLVSGLAIYQRGARRLVVGVGMVPRGEVGLIFAGLGLSLGLGGPDLYASLVTVVMLSTFIVPVWLRALYRAKPG
ncbi:MAG: cation:proton antiporter [Candidatus Rokubacteria bacterium]|nr:cation:proton antiporter [Candidatus Rokubacteria bacterium]